jgi:hypothetical protein
MRTYPQLVTINGGSRNSTINVFRVHISLIHTKEEPDKIARGANNEATSLQRAIEYRGSMVPSYSTAYRSASQRDSRQRAVHSLVQFGRISNSNIRSIVQSQPRANWTNSRYHHQRCSILSALLCPACLAEWSHFARFRYVPKQRD